MPRSKKGRLAGGARKEINESRASEAVNIAFMSDKERAKKHEVVDFVFGRVTKLTGANHVRVAIVAKHGNREVPARIPNIFARRGATPITTRSIVTIHTGEGFNPDERSECTAVEHFDITSILTDRQVSDLKKAGLIPDWMTNVDATAASAGKADEDGFVWATAEDDAAEGKKSKSDDEDGKAAAGAGFSRKKARDSAAAGGDSDSDDFDIDDI